MELFDHRLYNIQVLMIKKTVEDSLNSSFQLVIKSSRLKPTKKNIDEDSYSDQGKNFGHWSEEENTNYVIFVQGNLENFQRRKHRKIWKIFKTMSNFIGSRDTYQCRSHHQKMLAKYGTVKTLLKQMKLLYPGFDFVQGLAQFYKTNKIIPKEKKENKQIQVKGQRQEAIIKEDQTIMISTIPPTEPIFYPNFFPAFSYYNGPSLQFLSFIENNLWANSFFR